VIETPRAARVLHFSTLDSTNEEALRQLAAGAAMPLWIVADEQTRGRGRAGRFWQSPKGNLYATHVLTATIGATLATQLSFVAALSAHDAILPFLPPARRSALALKWPNDVMLDGAKIAGVLLESLAAPAGGLAVILGTGINVSRSPEALARPVASLGLTQAEVWPVFMALSQALDRWMGLWDDGLGFPAIRAEWLARAYALQESVSVNLNGAFIRGRFRGVDPAGALQLETAPGVVVTITAGEIHADPAR
jgi:BirA family transcriptional regulator, biotin operon repressor / biotin---[acetyl-CoA-carboxylase] ligase